MSVVTEEEFPHGIRCTNCHTEILVGEEYRDRPLSQAFITEAFGVVYEGVELICVAC